MAVDLGDRWEFQETIDSQAVVLFINVLAKVLCEPLMDLGPEGWHGFWNRIEEALSAADDGSNPDAPIRAAFVREALLRSLQDYVYLHDQKRPPRRQ